MVSSSALLAVLSLASTALGGPWDQTAKHATHRARSVGDAKFESYYPDSTYEVLILTFISFVVNYVPFQTYGFGDPIDHPPPPNGESDLESLAISFLEQKLNVDAETISYQQGYTGDVAKYAYMQQLLVSFHIVWWSSKAYLYR